ncbi:MAG: serine acetyltransferase [Firmicutes bacterium]|nr:serine acetyltransferase [Bacillota bacterium]
MKDNIKNVINTAVKEITENCKNQELFITGEGRKLPSRHAVIQIIKEFRRVIFPGYFGNENIMASEPEYFIGHTVTQLYEALKEQIRTALIYKNLENLPENAIDERADEICCHLFKKIPYIQKMLLKDIQAGFDGDPAAKSKEEIIFSYPGLFAIYVYRIAHELYKMKVPFVPRIMTEHAHSRTGIDINAGAEIGEYFFIDHGTGIVIGETTNIGNNVKLYQGVTLGALSTRQGQLLSDVKRHPTIEDNVTIYSGASILGGNTVIGANSVIGGNVFITESVPAGTKVTIKDPELDYRYEQ